MKIFPINDSDSDFEKVVLITVNGKEYPYCKQHGAMHKMADDKPDGVIWRCSVTSETRCRAGVKI